VSEFFPLAHDGSEAFAGSANMYMRNGPKIDVDVSRRKPNTGSRRDLASAPTAEPLACRGQPPDVLFNGHGGRLGGRCSSPFIVGARWWRAAKRSRTARAQCSPPSSPGQASRGSFYFAPGAGTLFLYESATFCCCSDARVPPTVSHPLPAAFSSTYSSVLENPRYYSWRGGRIHSPSQTPYPTPRPHSDGNLGESVQTAGPKCGGWDAFWGAGSTMGAARGKKNWERYFRRLGSIPAAVCSEPLPLAAASPPPPAAPSDPDARSASLSAARLCARSAAVAFSPFSPPDALFSAAPSASSAAHPPLPAAPPSAATSPFPPLPAPAGEPSAMMSAAGRSKSRRSPFRR
jgi:hypothetical protein